MPRFGYAALAAMLLGAVSIAPADAAYRFSAPSYRPQVQMRTFTPQVRTYTPQVRTYSRPSFQRSYTRPSIQRTYTRPNVQRNFNRTVTRPNVNRPNMVTRPNMSHPQVGSRPNIRPNVGMRPGMHPNIGSGPGIRPNVGMRPPLGHPFAGVRPRPGHPVQVGFHHPAHQLPFYRPGRVVGGVLAVGAGTYYYNNYSYSYVSYMGSGFDVEDFVRSLPDDGVLPSDDPAYGQADPEQDGQQWTAVSMAPDNGYKSTWRRPTKQAAEDAALEGCRENSKMPDKCQTVSSQQWIAAVRCDTDTESRATVAAGENSKVAISNAYKTVLGDGEYQKDDCKLSTMSAANGDQTKFSESKKAQ